MVDKGLLERFEAVREDVARAAREAGRDPGEVRIVAVSKRHPLCCVEDLAGAGHLDFGESYVQEAVAKCEAAACREVRWHFIGGLQSNKAKFIPGNFHMVHSVDSLKLARSLDRKCLEKGVALDVLIQVSLAGESQKSGVDPEGLADLVREMGSMEGLRLRGLMTMPPFDPDPERSRPYFARLRELRGELEESLGTSLPELSMGMTGDYRQAIEEGATLVRIGTRIFGPRA